MVARFGVGYDNVDVEACDENGIAVVITPDGVRRPVAVAIMTLMLALTGKMMKKDALTRQGPGGWAQRSDYMGVGIVGLTLGSIGIGNIGAEMFRLAKAFDMDFVAHDPFANEAVARDLGIRLVELDDVFREADVVTINCPLSESTRGLVNADRLALMKPTAYLINTARGPIVDQGALTKVLQDGRIAGAGLDVFENEPSSADDPLFKLEKCYCDAAFLVLDKPVLRRDRRGRRAGGAGAGGRQGTGRDRQPRNRGQLGVAGKTGAVQVCVRQPSAYLRGGTVWARLFSLPAAAAA